MFMTSDLEICEYIADKLKDYNDILKYSKNLTIEIPNIYRETFYPKTLSHGIPSLVMMYSVLYKITGNEEYFLCSYRYIERLVKLINEEGIESPSLYAGTAGIALAIYEASLNKTYYSGLLNDLNSLLKKQINEKLKLCFSNLSDSNIKPDDYDMVNGFSGIVNYLLLEKEFFVKELEKIGYYLKKLIEFYLSLFSKVDNNLKIEEIDLGMAHGIIGPLLMLAKLVEEGLISEDIKGVIEEFVIFFLNCRREDGLWPGKMMLKNYKKSNIANSPSRMAWCYGTPGVGVALYKVCSYFEFSYKGEIVKSLLEQINSKEKNLNSYSFCHGAAGNSYIYYLMGNREHNELMRTFSSFLRQKVIDNFSLSAKFGYYDIDKIGDKIVKLESVGILQGVSGLILFLIDKDGDFLWKKMFL